MTTRATLAAAMKNVRYLQGYARDHEESASASAALARLTALDATFGDLMDAIDAADAHAASVILARLIAERTPRPRITVA